MSFRKFAAAALAVGLAVGVGQASAQAPRELRIALGASVTSTDPHYHNLATNSMVAAHFFDTLIQTDEQQRLTPGLALSWKTLDDTTWEFKLRPNVKFHDGSDFDAKDVMATVKRAPAVPNSPSSFNIYLSAIKEVKEIEPLTIHIVTHAPSPLLPNELSQIYIISDRNVDMGTADYNSGKAMAGTGPYKFIEYVPGERIVMERNPSYFRGAEPWSKVTLRAITNPTSRVAALRAGDVDVIDAVPTSDIESLKKIPDISVVNAASNRVIYFHMLHQSPKLPLTFVKGTNQPLEKNPIQDLRVRKALSKAINRQAIVDRVMEGNAIAAAQLLPDGFFGVSKNLKVEAFDPDGARKLLAEAGYPNGFSWTIHSCNDRYINDEKVTQAVAQMWSRIGIETKVETMPWATYAGRASRQEFGMFLVGWGAGTGEVSSPLRSLLATFDQTKGWGPSNRGRYSNPKMDAVMAKALETVDDGAREKLLAEASELAVDDLGIIPLHYEVSTWAARKGFTFKGRADQYTFAMNARPAQ